MADRKTDRKHLFGTSDSSDFILNMTDAGAKKFCAMFCIIAMILIEAVALPYYLTKKVVDYKEEIMGVTVEHYVSEKVIYWASVVMLGIGLLGLSVFLIGKMKKQFVLKDNKALLWLVGVIVMSFISALAAEDLMYAMTGYQDRAEGMLTLLGYYGFFAAAFTVVAENWRVRICGTIIGIGALNAVIGILQVIPALRGKIPNWFDVLKTHPEESINISLDVDVPAANGLAMAPHALAGLLTVTFAVAFTAFIFAKKPLYKALSGVSAILMVVAGLYTRTATALIGLSTAAVLVFVVAVIAAFKNTADSEENIGSSKKSIALACIGLAAAVGAGLVMNFTDQLKFYDEEVIRADSERMLMLMRREDESMWVYPYLWDEGLYISEDNIALGTGPDNFGKMLDLGAVIDRSYNEYIDVAMQRGWITLGLYVIFLLVTVGKAFKALAMFIRREVNWAAAAVFSAVLAYLVQAFFNVSALTSTPFFFICAGLVWSYGAKMTIAEKNEKKKSRSGDDA